MPSNHQPSHIDAQADFEIQQVLQASSKLPPLNGKEILDTIVSYPPFIRYRLETTLKTEHFMKMTKGDDEWRQASQ